MLRTQKSMDRSLKFCRIATEVFILLMLFLYPLFVGFWGYTRLTDSKFVFFAAVTCGWLLCLLVGQCCMGFVRLRAKASAVSLLLAAFLLLCGVSALLSPYRDSVALGGGRYDGLITTALCCCIFFGVRLYGTPKKRYLYALALAAALNCVVAVIQLFGVNALGLFPADYTYYDSGVKYSGEFLGLIGNVDLFSALLCLTLPAAMGVYIASGSRPLLLLPCMALMCFILTVCGASGGRLAFAVVLLLCAPFLVTNSERLKRALEVWTVLALSAALALAFEGVRGDGGVSVTLRASPLVWAAVCLSAALALLRIVLKSRRFKSKSLRRFFALFNAFVAVSALLGVYFVDTGSGAFSELHNILHGHIEDGYGSSRILIWKDTLALIGERPLLGGGPGTVAERLDIHFARYVAETGETLKTGVDNAHNVYLGIAADTGLISLLLYVAAQLVTVAAVLKKRRLQPILLCILCGLFCYWCSDFFNLGLFIVSPIMWVLWGLACGVPQRGKGI